MTSGKQRAISNDITINPLEYLLDEDGEVMAFNGEGEAKAFLRGKGLTDDVIDGLIFQTENTREAMIYKC